MGFFLLPEIVDNKSLRGVDINFLHRQQCHVCPLNNQSHLRHPHMQPSGSSHPLVYMLGEAPGQTEDRRGRPFVGQAGRVVHSFISKSWEDDIRWNNCIRTHPPKNRDPTPVEIECCRPSIVADIEKSNPRAIFGLGNVPLHWAIKTTGITLWRGRRVPVRIGNRCYWFYPMLHPSGLLHMTDGQRKVMEFVAKMDMRRAFDEVDAGLPPAEVHTIEQAEDNIEAVTGTRGRIDLERIDQHFDQLEADGKVVGFDYETKKLRPYEKDARLLSVAFAGRHKSMAIALDHPGAEWREDYKLDVKERIHNFLHRSRCRKAVHNLAFELEWSGKYFSREVVYAGKWGCTMAQAWMLDERIKKMRNGPLSLSFLTMQYFGLDIKSMSPLDKNNLDQEPVQSVLRYNAIDGKYHRLLFVAQNARLRQEGLREVCAHHVQRIMTMSLTQMKGVPVDQQIVDKFYQHYSNRLDKAHADLLALPICREFKQACGVEFAPSKNKDVVLILKEFLHIKDLENTEEHTLKKINHPFVKALLKWRKIAKLLSTYIHPFRADDEHSTIMADGLLHPIIGTCNTTTARTSSDSPNIQNVPKHQDNMIRKQVRPGGNRYVVAFDYAGIQARNVAMESNDKTLVQHFWDKYDIHGDWARRIQRICDKHQVQWCPEGRRALEDKKHELFGPFRQKAKNKFVFASFFGAQPETLATGLEVPEEIAEEALDEFWDEYPDIKGWHEKLYHNYYRYGYVTGLSGYRRRAPIARNKIINAPIQADESIIVCAAMDALSKRGDRRLQPNIMVHDDLTFIWEKCDVDKLVEVVAKVMIEKRFPWINVPLVVECSIGRDWYSLEKRQPVCEWSSD